MATYLERILEPTTNSLETTILFTDLLQVKISRTTLKNEIEEHPDYPSLLSIGDVLTRFGIENIAAKFSADKLTELPLPFITVIKSENYRTGLLTVVKEIKDGVVTLTDPENYRWIKMSIDEFSKRSNRVVLLSETKENAGEKDYDKIRRKEQNNLAVKYVTMGIIPVLALATGILLFVDSGMAALLPFLFSLLTLCGSIVGVLLLWYELDQFNPVLQQICTAGKKTDCNSILHSKGARIFGISWSAIGFSWFTGNLTCLLIAGVTHLPNLWILAWLNLPATGYILYSLYYQWKIAKQWCLLCLSVQGILFLQGIVIFIAGWRDLFPLHSLTPALLLQTTAAFAIPGIAVALLLPALRNAKASFGYNAALKRLKHNPQIFESLLSKEKIAHESLDGLGILLGNPQATHKITKVCNPYCAPCATIHPIIDELLDNNPDIQLQIIFTATSRENDLRAVPVKHLLAIAAKENEAYTREALDTWYLAPEKDYDTFAAKYPMNGELRLQAEKIQAMETWCKQTEITYTPTLFVNGHQLPEIYTVSDLKYFLSV